ncbi:MULTISPECIES: nucleotidyltransferase family protein [unclassified Sulfurospirillum]|uniref:nucleotidyltransferase family protein n=1 Tax=unclassified Sulfurospirillum TaxID=2618290 RepID=UPI000508A27E|nr:MULTISPECIES: nucleotidyltransferase family protein [unclassified Sulfurospirillum]KFL34222.1 alcohol dehydrogenase [Sulfurospirillum sp. SCADC]
MQTIEHIKLTVSSTIKEAMQVIDTGAMKIAVVLDPHDHLIGILTDGDIRRGFLAGMNLNEKIESIVQKSPIVCHVGETKDEILQKSLGKRIYHLPILDSNEKVVGIEDVEELFKPHKKSNKVVLMAGGLGTRLHPLTQQTPKPMLRVGDQPILETIINNFKHYGFFDFIISVNYKADVLKNYFGDGSKFGVSIEYINETMRMGTAGALSLIEEKFTEPIFVMNGDLLTNINFDHLLNFHLSNNAMATMAVREHEFQIPYGVIHQTNQKIISIEEKPIQRFFINAGIYLLNPNVLAYIPKETFFDMPSLFETLIQNNYEPLSFPIREYWLDIGRMDEFEKAQNDYYDLF